MRKILIWTILLFFQFNIISSSPLLPLVNGLLSGLTQTDLEYTNVAADSTFVNKLNIEGSKRLAYVTNCDKTEGKLCMRATEDIPAETVISTIYFSDFLDEDTVLSYFHDPPKILEKNPLYATTCLLLSNEFDNKESFYFAYMARLKDLIFVEGYCAKRSPMCTPHFWPKENQQSLFPTKAYGV